MSLLFLKKKQQPYEYEVKSPCFHGVSSNVLMLHVCIIQAFRN